MVTKGIITLVYGSLISIGGVIGFLKAKSKPSLIAGVGLGSIAEIGGVLLILEQPAGLWMGVASAVLVSGFAASRIPKALREGTGMGRAMGMLVLSAGTLIALFIIKP